MTIHGIVHKYGWDGDALPQHCFNQSFNLAHIQQLVATLQSGYTNNQICPMDSSYNTPAMDATFATADVQSPIVWKIRPTDRPTDNNNIISFKISTTLQHALLQEKLPYEGRRMSLNSQ